MNILVYGIMLILGIFIGCFTVVFITILPEQELNQELIVSGASMAIALSALIVTLRQTYTSEMHQRRSLRPGLNLLCSVDGNGNTLTLNVHNHGLGPAIIKHFAILVDGEAVDLSHYSNLAKALAPIVKKQFKGTLGAANIDIDTMFPGNGDRNLINLEIKNPNVDIFEIYERIKHRLLVQIDYESLHGEPYSLEDTI